MRTACSSPYRGSPWQRHPSLDIDLPWQRPPWTETPWTEAPLQKETPWTETPHVNRQTRVKIVPCPKLRLLTVKINRLVVCIHCQTARQRARPIKKTCLELCGGVHTTQRQRPVQISKWFCTHFISQYLYRSRCRAVWMNNYAIKRNEIIWGKILSF